MRHEFDNEPFSPPPLPRSESQNRFLLYSHDSWGLGHLRRSLTLASGLVETFPDVEVLLITGSPCATLFPTPPGVGLVKIPSVSKTAGGEYVPRSLAGSLEETLRLRRNLILEAYRSFQPNLVMVDHKVIGLHGEAYEVLREARQDGVHTILGVRDIIDSPGAVAVEWGGEKCRWALSDGFERVCVYGSPEVFDTRVEYSIPAELGERIEFMGYVVRPVPVRAASAPHARPQVLVTIGGGEDGASQLESYMTGMEKMRPDWDSVLVGGPLLSEREARRLRRRAEILGNVQVRRFHADMPFLLHECDAVVAMAGYNTCSEILQSGKASVLLPRTHPRMEQAIRAERFERLGLTTSLIDPQPEDLVRCISKALEKGNPAPELIPPLNGVENVCRLAKKMLANPKRVDPISAKRSLRTVLES